MNEDLWQTLLLAYPPKQWEKQTDHGFFAYTSRMVHTRVINKESQLDLLTMKKKGEILWFDKLHTGSFRGKR